MSHIYIPYIILSAIFFIVFLTAWIIGYDETADIDKTTQRIFGCLAVFMAIAFISSIHRFSNEKYTHLGLDDEVFLSSQINMKYIYKALDENFSFSNVNIHLIKENNNIVPLKNNNIVLSVKKIKNKDDMALAEIVYITEVENNHNEKNPISRYEWHKDLALMPKSSLESIEHNIFLTTYNVSYDYYLKHAESENAPIDVRKDLDILNNMIKSQ